MEFLLYVLAGLFFLAVVAEGACEDASLQLSERTVVFFHRFAAVSGSLAGIGICMILLGANL